MRCPHCGSDDDKVIDSRTLAKGESIRRRRECLACGFRFTSYERIEEKPLMVVKRDGRREPFERSKIEKGIRRALEKRPVSQLSIENLVNELEDAAAMRGKTANEIGTVELGEMVLEYIFTIDKVAYVRFASVYRKFETLEEFLDVIEGLAKGGQTPARPAQTQASELPLPSAKPQALTTKSQEAALARSRGQSLF
jgi:transcriptional repressor NrdR